MENKDARRSDRVPVELPIVVTGTDAMGAGFLEQTRTVMVGRHGAKIRLVRMLVPDQEINIRCLKTSRESDARVVGQLGSEGESHFYGIELLDDDPSLWGIEFPPPSESDAAVGRVLLECVRCHSQELAYLDEFEVEVLEINQSLSRHCRRCTDTSMWKKSTPREGAEPPAQPPPPHAVERETRRTRNDRKHVRLDLKVDVCVRHPQHGEEVATTINVSRGGFRFKSSKGYGEGWVIEAALPYSKTGANIFTPARIVYVGEAPGEKAYVYGVMYLPKMQAEITI
ncbi:MAG: PilZ domain-containing protein [Deltaproteobacteria bacterium]